DIISANCMLSAYAQGGHDQDAKRLFDAMPDRDLVSWNALLSTYGRCGQLQEAQMCFRRMPWRSTRTPPDEACFVSALVACGQLGEVYMGRSCFISMSMDFGLCATKQHYCCMVDLLGRAGHLIQAEELMHNMPFVPDS
ncbi:hypothetical protein SELMODRAFT_72489, partial [Selaginella moellendorffii]